MKSKIFLTLFIISIILFGLNIIGLFNNLRCDDIYKVKDLHWDIACSGGIELSEKEFHQELDKIFDNTAISDSAKVSQTTVLVEDGLLHYWSDEKRKEYNLTIPVYENYILYALSYYDHRMFAKYQFLNWKKTIERGVAICSQHAIAESEILNERGIESNIVKLNGHVVVRAKVGENKYFILDPDFGVTLPFDIDVIEKNTKIIEPYYEGNVCDVSDMENLTKVYDADGNKIVKNAITYMVGYGNFEIISYWLIWIIPALLMLPFGVEKFRWQENK